MHGLFSLLIQNPHAGANSFDAHLKYAKQPCALLLNSEVSTSQAIFFQIND
jgi:hypothetical protein